MAEERSAKDVLASILDRPGSDTSATDTIRLEQEEAESINRVWNEYVTIGQAAQSYHWDELLERNLGPADWEQVRSSEAIGPLHIALVQAQAHGIDVEAELPRLCSNLVGLHDPAAGIEARITKLIDAQVRSGRTTDAGLIAGLLPRMAVPDPDIARALAERDRAMEAHAEAKLAEALGKRERWVASLGEVPASPAARLAWERKARTVAAYRERWGGPVRMALHPAEDCRTLEQRTEWGRAKRALYACRRLAAGEQESALLKARTPGIDMAMDL